MAGREDTRDRTRELELLLDISRALSSTLELRPLLELILDKVEPVLHYDGAGVSLMEPGGIRQLAVRRPPGYPVSTDEAQHFVPISAQDAIWSRVRRGESFVVDDVWGDTPEAIAYRVPWGGETRGTPVEYVRCLMTVPLIARSQPIGVLNFARSEPGTFTERDLALAEATAGLAATAIENARLFEQTQARTRELRALLEVSRAVSSTLDLGEVLGTILDELGAITEHTGASILLFRDDALEFVDARSMTGTTATIGARIPLSVAPGLTKLMQGGETVIIDDIRADEPLAADYRAAIASIGMTDRLPFDVIRSWMSVPLALKDRILGVLTISWTEPGHFTEEHAALARAFADQAATAIENARLFTETQSRTQEMSALLEVSRAISSTLDLRDAMGVVMDEMQTIVRHSGSVMLVVEGDDLVVTESRADVGGAEREIGARMPLAESGLIWEVMKTREPIIIPDVRANEPLAHAFWDATRSLGIADQMPFNVVRSWMAVPLAIEDEVIGMIALSWSEPGYFTREHARLVAAFASQAALAIDHARLYSETRQRAREHEALSRADAELFRSLDLNVVMQALVDVTVDVLGVHKSMVATWDQDSERLTLRAARNFNERSLSMIRDMYDSGLGKIQDPMIIATEDPRHAHPAEAAVVQEEGIHSYIQVPVVSTDGVPLGFFSVGYTTEHHFDEDEQRLLSALADRAAVAIGNADLYERSQRVASLEERQRLARELHDSVSQALYGIALGARTARTILDREPQKAIEPVDYVLSLAEAGLAEMRALIFELRPESLETEGLVAALEKQIAAARARYGLEITAELCEEPDIPIESKEALYRITQEALHNVVKHASATSVRISLSSAGDGRLSLAITDNGRGFDPGAEFPGHLGLRSMKERAEKTGATLQISSKPGEGARVTVSLPLR